MSKWQESAFHRLGERLEKNGAHWMGNLEKNKRLVTDIVSVLPSKEPSCVAADFRTANPAEVERAARPVKAACSTLAKKADAGYGYSIELLDEFVWEKEEKWFVHFPGLFLTLLSPDSKAVGMLEFSAGLPFEIITVQGQDNKEPKKFSFASNGKTFDIVLLKHLIKCISGNVQFPLGERMGRVPKAEFNFYCGVEGESEKILKRLSEFIDQKERERFVKRAGMGRVPLRPELFRSEWRQAQRQALAR